VCICNEFVMFIYSYYTLLLTTTSYLPYPDFIRDFSISVSNSQLDLHAASQTSEDVDTDRPVAE